MDERRRQSGNAPSSNAKNGRPDQPTVNTRHNKMTVDYGVHCSTYSLHSLKTYASAKTIPLRNSLLAVV